MKKFIIKTSWFVIPFIFLHFINLLFYKKEGGDLARLGFIYFNPSPFVETIKQFDDPPIEYTPISKVNLNDKEIKFKVLTIGDSFSEQGGYSYQNYLAYKGVSVGHIDRFLSEESPIQTLVELINSDFFDTVKTDYIVLESVERALMIRNSFLSFEEKRTLADLKKQIEEREGNSPGFPPSSRLEFFSDATIKIPLTNFQYLFLARPFRVGIYRFKAQSNTLFTNNPYDLLFFKDDLKTLKKKNSDDEIKKLNDNLNKISQLLKKKNIKLVFLIAPDKYDLYYPYIKNKPKDKEPLFFQKFQNTKKEYLYVPSYKILFEALKEEKDIYFYDDTHWTPKGSKLIANEVYKIVEGK